MKQLTSMHTGQPVVISHPYDLSHNIHLHKSFNFQAMQKVKQKPNPFLKRTEYHEKFEKRSPRQIK